MPGTRDILFISHGGGPLPLLGDPSHRDMVSQLEALARDLSRPDAILLVSAHWEAPVPTVTAGPHPELIYDYYGFPAESYDIQYPCPGEPALAAQVARTLARAGLPAREDATRGFDHGLFVPLKIMYPEADIPCVQLSLVDSLDAHTHLAIGEALRALAYDRLLVIGSGFSFHNLQALRTATRAVKDARNRAFEDWLLETCGSPDLSGEARRQRLLNWEQAPHARYCHPREEHLLPLHVCCGLAGGRPSDRHIDATIMNTRSGMFHWSAAGR